MASVLRTVGHQDRLSIIDHLDELRSRLFVCLCAVVVIFSVCFWQNTKLLQILNKPLEEAGLSQNAKPGSLGTTGQAGTRLGSELAQAAAATSALSKSAGFSKAQQQQFSQLSEALGAASADLPRAVPKRQPITTAVGEPFTATLTVSAYFALLFSLPIILWQAYAFVLPAFSGRERRVVFPLMLMVPVLFTAGVLFGYFLVLPPAVSFLQNFNSGSFDILVQAKEYYGFVAMVLLAMGIIFQVPVGLLALNRAGIVSSGALIKHWRYIIVGIAVVAALLPGVDPVTTLLEMVPLLILYGLSILLLKFAERRDGEQGVGGGWALDHHLDDPNAEGDQPTPARSGKQTTTNDHEEDLSD